MTTVNSAFIAAVRADIEEAQNFGDQLWAAKLEGIAAELEGQGDTSEAIADLALPAEDKRRIYGILDEILAPAA